MIFDLCVAGDLTAVQKALQSFKAQQLPTDLVGSSPLHYAAKNNRLDIAKLFLDSKKCTLTNKMKKTPLHLAAQEGYADMCSLLLQYGVDVNAQDIMGMTPLHWAVTYERYKVVGLLMDHGADPNILDLYGRSPLSIADVNISILSQLNHQQTEAKPRIEKKRRASEDVKEPGTKRRRMSQDNMRGLHFLKQHGISHLPEDNSTTVATALKNGQTAVLTEAGQQLLKLFKSYDAPDRVLQRLSKIYSDPEPNLSEAQETNTNDFNRRNPNFSRAKPNFPERGETNISRGDPNVTERSNDGKRSSEHVTNVSSDAKRRDYGFRSRDVLSDNANKCSVERTKFSLNSNKCATDSVSFIPESMNMTSVDDVLDTSTVKLNKSAVYSPSFIPGESMKVTDELLDEPNVKSGCGVVSMTEKYAPDQVKQPWHNSGGSSFPSQVDLELIPQLESSSIQADDELGLESPLNLDLTPLPIQPDFSPLGPNMCETSTDLPPIQASFSPIEPSISSSTALPPIQADFSPIGPSFEDSSQLKDSPRLNDVAMEVANIGEVSAPLDNSLLDNLMEMKTCEVSNKSTDRFENQPSSVECLPSISVQSNDRLGASPGSTMSESGLTSTIAQSETMGRQRFSNVDRTGQMVLSKGTNSTVEGNMGQMVLNTNSTVRGNSDQRVPNACSDSPVSSSGHQDTVPKSLGTPSDQISSLTSNSHLLESSSSSSNCHVIQDTPVVDKSMQNGGKLYVVCKDLKTKRTMVVAVKSNADKRLELERSDKINPERDKGVATPVSSAIRPPMKTVNNIKSRPHVKIVGPSSTTVGNAQNFVKSQIVVIRPPAIRSPFGPRTVIAGLRTTQVGPRRPRKIVAKPQTIASYLNTVVQPQLNLVACTQPKVIVIPRLNNSGYKVTNCNDAKTVPNATSTSNKPGSLLVNQDKQNPAILLAKITSSNAPKIRNSLNAPSNCVAVTLAPTATTISSRTNVSNPSLNLNRNLSITLDEGLIPFSVSSHIRPLQSSVASTLCKPSSISPNDSSSLCTNLTPRTASLQTSSSNVLSSQPNSDSLNDSDVSPISSILSRLGLSPSDVSVESPPSNDMPLMTPPNSVMVPASLSESSAITYSSSSNAGSISTLSPNSSIIPSSQIETPVLPSFDTGSVSTSLANSIVLLSYSGTSSNTASLSTVPANSSIVSFSHSRTPSTTCSPSSNTASRATVPVNSSIVPLSHSGTSAITSSSSLNTAPLSIVPVNSSIVPSSHSGTPASRPSESKLTLVRDRSKSAIPNFVVVPAPLLSPQAKGPSTKEEKPLGVEPQLSNVDGVGSTNNFAEPMHVDESLVEGMSPEKHLGSGNGDRPNSDVKNNKTKSHETNSMKPIPQVKDLVSYIKLLEDNLRSSKNSNALEQQITNAKGCERIYSKVESKQNNRAISNENKDIRNRPSADTNTIARNVTRSNNVVTNKKDTSEINKGMYFNNSLSGNMSQVSTTVGTESANTLKKNVTKHNNLQINEQDISGTNKNTNLNSGLLGKTPGNSTVDTESVNSLTSYKQTFSPTQKSSKNTLSAIEYKPNPPNVAKCSNQYNRNDLFRSKSPNGYVSDHSTGTISPDHSIRTPSSDSESDDSSAQDLLNMLQRLITEVNSIDHKHPSSVVLNELNEHHENEVGKGTMFENKDILDRRHPSQTQRNHRAHASNKNHSENHMKANEDETNHQIVYYSPPRGSKTYDRTVRAHEQQLGTYDPQKLFAKFRKMMTKSRIILDARTKSKINDFIESLGYLNSTGENASFGDSYASRMGGFSEESRLERYRTSRVGATPEIAGNASTVAKWPNVLRDGSGTTNCANVPSNLGNNFMSGSSVFGSTEPFHASTSSSNVFGNTFDTNFSNSSSLSDSSGKIVELTEPTLMYNAADLPMDVCSDSLGAPTSLPANPSVIPSSILTQSEPSISNTGSALNPTVINPSSSPNPMSSQFLSRRSSTQPIDPQSVSDSAFASGTFPGVTQVSISNTGASFKPMLSKPTSRPNPMSSQFILPAASSTIAPQPSSSPSFSSSISPNASVSDSSSTSAFDGNFSNVVASSFSNFSTPINTMPRNVMSNQSNASNSLHSLAKLTISDPANQSVPIVSKSFPASLRNSSNVLILNDPIKSSHEQVQKSVSSIVPMSTHPTNSSNAAPTAFSSISRAPNSSVSLLRNPSVRIKPTQNLSVKKPTHSGLEQMRNPAKLNTVNVNNTKFSQPVGTTATVVTNVPSSMGSFNMNCNSPLDKQESMSTASRLAPTPSNNQLLVPTNTTNPPKPCSNNSLPKQPYKLVGPSNQTNPVISLKNSVNTPKTHYQPKVNSNTSIPPIPSSNNVPIPKPPCEPSNTPNPVIPSSNNSLNQPKPRSKHVFHRNETNPPLTISNHLLNLPKTSCSETIRAQSNSISNSIPSNCSSIPTSTLTNQSSVRKNTVGVTGTKNSLSRDKTTPLKVAETTNTVPIQPETPMDTNTINILGVLCTKATKNRVQSNGRPTQALKNSTHATHSTVPSNPSQTNIDNVVDKNSSARVVSKSNPSLGVTLKETTQVPCQVSTNIVAKKSRPRVVAVKRNTERPIVSNRSNQALAPTPITSQSMQIPNKVSAVIPPITKLKIKAPLILMKGNELIPVATNMPKGCIKNVPIVSNSTPLSPNVPRPNEQSSIL